MSYLYISQSLGFVKGVARITRNEYHRICTIPMAAPRLDVDREAVRVLVVAIGVREAARQMGLSENTVLSWANRGGWLQSVADARAIRDARNAPAMQSPAINPADALQNTLLERRNRTKLALSAWSVTASEHSATLSGEEALAAAPSVAQVATVASKVWPETAAPTVRISMFSAGTGAEVAIDGPVIDLEPS